MASLRKSSIGAHLRFGVLSGTPNIGSTIQANVTVEDGGANSTQVHFQWEVEAEDGDFLELPGANSPHFTPDVSMYGVRLRARCWVGDKIPEDEMYLETDPVGIDAETETILEEFATAGKATFQVTLLEDPEEDPEGTEAQLIWQRRHTAVWVDNECVHYSTITAKTEVKLVPNSPDGFVLLGKHGLQLFFSAGSPSKRDLVVLAFRQLCSDTAKEAGSPMKTPDSKASRQDIISASWTQGKNLRGALDAAMNKEGDATGPPATYSPSMRSTENHLPPRTEPNDRRKSRTSNPGSEMPLQVSELRLNDEMETLRGARGSPSFSNSWGGSKGLNLGSALKNARAGMDDSSVSSPASHRRTSNLSVESSAARAPDVSPAEQLSKRISKAGSGNLRPVTPATTAVMVVVNCPTCGMAIAGPADVKALPCPACHTMVEIANDGARSIANDLLGRSDRAGSEGETSRTSEDSGEDSDFQYGSSSRGKEAGRSQMPYDSYSQDRGRFSKEEAAIMQGGVIDDEEEELIEQMAQHLGLDLHSYPHLRWIAEECLDLEPPEGWSEHTNDDGAVYYHNKRTGETTWSHPMDNHYMMLVKQLTAQHDMENGDGKLGTSAQYETRINPKFKEKQSYADADPSIPTEPPPGMLRRPNPHFDSDFPEERPGGRDRSSSHVNPMLGGQHPMLMDPEYDDDGYPSRWEHDESEAHPDPAEAKPSKEKDTSMSRSWPKRAEKGLKAALKSAIRTPSKSKAEKKSKSPAVTDDESQETSGGDRERSDSMLDKSSMSTSWPRRTGLKARLKEAVMGKETRR